ncbi:MAG: ABC transporter substrate-binding protein [Aeromicrobium sp.]
MPGDSTAFGAFTDPEIYDLALDPHWDWPAPHDTGELLRCCLARTLLSTNGRAVHQGGSRLQPDAAESLPEISSDGLTWTFRIKQGLHYAPPLEGVELTAPDFIRSFHRFLMPGTESYPATLYSDIVGAAAYMAGDAASISGLESPDPHTLVIRLTAPAGDLAARLAASAIVPIPPNPSSPSSRFGVAEGHDDGYGRFMASSGPYMIEGSPELDFSLSANEQQPVAGLVPGERITLVPNPSWDPVTDPLRVALPGRIELTVVPTFDDALAAINAGETDLMVNFDGDLPADAVEALSSDPSLGKVFVNEIGTQTGITINLAMPPFDDIHVRRAVNFIVDKQAIVDAIGGPLRLRTAHHVVPDSMEDNLLVDYRPYETDSRQAALEAAQAEVAQSRYDSNGDGLCDADVCRDVLAGVAGGDEPSPMFEIVAANLSTIGVELADEPIDAFDALVDPGTHAGLLMPHGWGRDYLSASNFFVGQFYSPITFGGDVPNGSLVGASAEQLEAWGYETTEVPNVDSRIEACVPLTGSAQFECWAALDQYLMENVVLSIPIGSGVLPILASGGVSNYSWDELAVAPAYDRIEIAE